MQVSIDDDLSARLRQEAEKAGKSLDEIVNERLRAALPPERTDVPREKFVVKARSMGTPKVPLDCIPAVLEYLDGPFWR